jgi:hypothetical protein
MSSCYSTSRNARAAFPGRWGVNYSTKKNSTKTMPLMPLLRLEGPFGVQAKTLYLKNLLQILVYAVCKWRTSPRANCTKAGIPRDCSGVSSEAPPLFLQNAALSRDAATKQ